MVTVAQVTQETEAQFRRPNPPGATGRLPVQPRNLENRADLGHSFWASRLGLPRITRIQPDAAHPSRLLHQFARRLRALTRHYIPGRQREPQRIRLILKIKHNLARHKLLPGSSQCMPWIAWMMEPRHPEKDQSIEVRNNEIATNEVTGPNKLHLLSRLWKNCRPHQSAFLGSDIPSNAPP